MLESIYSFDSDFDPRSYAGITDRFLADAGTYHQKHTNLNYWRFMLSQALARAGIRRNAAHFVLNVGAGSGNSVIPLFELLPNSAIAAAISALPCWRYYGGR